MNKILAFLLIFAMLLALSACRAEGNYNNADGDGASPSDRRETLDVFAGVTVKFQTAINGCGDKFDIEFDHTKVNYDKSNTDIKTFLEAIEFSADTYSKLSNGDKIVVNASWSKSAADALGVKLLEESKEFTVTGLYTVYRSAADVPVTPTEVTDILETLASKIAWVLEVNHEIYDAPRSYRWYYAYSNDSNGEPYISYIYLTAVVKLEHKTLTFLGYNYLYQDCLKENMKPQAEESNRVSEIGELLAIDGAVKLEEFFLD